MHDKRHIVLFISGTGTLVLGLMALGGWQTQQLEAFRLAHGWVPAHCGIAFIFAGLSFVLAAFRFHRLVQLAAITIEAVALVIFVDQVRAISGLPPLMPFPDLDLAPYAYHVTGHSLFCFVLLGVALFILGLARPFAQRGLVLAMIGATIIALPISEILGLALGVNAPNAEGFVAVVLFTAPAHLLTAWGIITFAWYDAPLPQRTHTHWPPLLLIVSVLSATLLAWEALDTEQDRFVNRIAELRAVSITNEIEHDVRSYVGALLRMAQRWEHVDQPSLAFREASVRQYLVDLNGLRAIESVDSRGRIAWGVGHASGIVGSALTTLLPNAAERNTATFSNFLVDEESSVYLLLAIPFRSRPQSERGFLIATFDARALLQDVLSHAAAEGYAVAVRQGALEAYGLNRDDALEPWGQEKTLSLYGSEWRVRVVPTPDALIGLRGAVPRVVLFAGILLTVLLVWIDHLAHKANVRAEDLAEEVGLRERAEAELLRLNVELEHRVRQATTELREANRNLAAEKDLLDVTLHSIGDAVITTDIDGRVLSINKVAEDLTGWTPGDAVGQPIDTVFRIVDAKTRRATASPMAHVLHTGLVAHLAGDTLLIGHDGRERLIADSAAPIRDRQGKTIGVVLAFHDISETRKMEEDLFKAKNLEAIGLLAGGIAHDFNNILTAILGHVALAKLYATPGDPIDENLTQAEKAFARARDLTLQLLTFSKGGAPIRQAASIAELVQDTTGFVLRGSNIRYEITVPPDLWPASVDPGQISQALNNLLLNAKQAMPRGGVVSISGDNVRVDPGDARLRAGRYVKLTLRDQGAGIPVEELPKIFDPYFTTKEGGTGLGLATTYSIVKRHQGHIEVESEVGRGTVFHLYLPAAERVAERHAVPASEMLHGHGRVLVMDDEATIREVAAKMLQSLGYESVTVSGGDEAVAAYRDAQRMGMPFDAVLLDLTVPGGMGGQECLERMREINPNVSAILSSGYSNDPIMANYRAYGFLGMVAKPYQLDELARALAGVIPSDAHAASDRSPRS
jgi:PAS domain S-box-containing protein